MTIAAIRTKGAASNRFNRRFISPLIRSFDLARTAEFQRCQRSLFHKLPGGRSRSDHFKVACLFHHSHSNLVAFPASLLLVFLPESRRYGSVLRARDQYLLDAEREHLRGRCVAISF